MSTKHLNYTKNIISKKRGKEKIDFIIDNKKYYTYDLNSIYYYTNNVIIIQKYWRSYKKRIFINKVYKKLPNDIQNKILFYVRENYLIKKYHHNIIKNILSKKLKITDILYLKFYTGDQKIIDYQNNKLKNLIYIFKLYNKYYSIAPFYNILFINKYLDDLIKLFESLYLMYIFDNKLITELLNLLKIYKKLSIDTNNY